MIANRLGLGIRKWASSTETEKEKKLNLSLSWLALYRYNYILHFLLIPRTAAGHQGDSTDRVLPAEQGDDTVLPGHA